MEEKSLLNEPISEVKTSVSSRNDRQSGYELLRILSMLMIVAVHCGWFFEYNEHVNYLQANYIFISIFRSFGQVGVVTFILISGYFLSSAKFKSLSIFKLFLQVFLYGWLLYGAYYIVVKYGNPTLLWQTGIISKIFIVTRGEFWFFSAYFVMYLLFPFINNMLNGLTKNQMRLLLGILFLYVSINPILSEQNVFSQNVGNVFLFLFLFMIGSYIRRYPEDFENGKLALIILLVTVGLYWFFTIKYVPIIEKTNSIFIITISVMLFVCFGKLKFKSKIINTVSSTTFGIYILHENSVFRYFIWKDIFHIKDFADKKWFIPAVIGIVLTVFIVCGAIDLIRQYLIEKPLFKLLGKSEKFNNITKRIDGLYPYSKLETVKGEKNNTVMLSLFTVIIADSIVDIIKIYCKIDMLYQYLIFFGIICLTVAAVVSIKKIKCRKS